jgi:hypothetical protein
MARRAQRKPARRTRTTGSVKSRTPSRRSGKRPIAKASAKAKSAGASRSRRKPSVKKAVAKHARSTRAAAKKAVTRKAAPRKATRPQRPPLSKRAAAPTKAPRLDRERRTLEETVQTPPSSLDMNRRGSAARTGRAEIAETRAEQRGMTTAITAGDADADVEKAYFTGDEAPGGDNPGPDEDVVDDIGKALGVQYEDNEELKASDKITERDKHRWEMDPASSEDYKDRK